MAAEMSGSAVLDRYFLEMRCELLNLAASLDRVDSGGQPVPKANDLRLENLRAALRALLDDRPDRARRVQMIFSDAYQPEWERPATRS